MNNRPPLNEGIATGVPLVTPGWANWFSQVFGGMPWKKGWNVTAVLDFGSVAAFDQGALTVTITGARAGDAVQVTSTDRAGVIFTGVVTADDTVTIYAKNYTAGPIDPSSRTFRIIVLQN